MFQQVAAQDNAVTATDPIIRIEGLNEWYCKLRVLKNIDLVVAKGERIVICGPSGSPSPMRWDSPARSPTGWFSWTLEKSSKARHQRRFSTIRELIAAANSSARFLATDAVGYFDLVQTEYRRSCMDGEAPQSHV